MNDRYVIQARNLPLPIHNSKFKTHNSKFITDISQLFQFIIVFMAVFISDRF